MPRLGPPPHLGLLPVGLPDGLWVVAAVASTLRGVRFYDFCAHGVWPKLPVRGRAQRRSRALT